MFQEKQKKKALSRSLKKLTEVNKIRNFSNSQKIQLKFDDMETFQNASINQKNNYKQLNFSLKSNPNSRINKTEITSKTEQIKRNLINILPDIRQKKRKVALSGQKTQNFILKSSQISLSVFKRNSIVQKNSRPKFNGSAKVQFKQIKFLNQMTKDDKIMKYLQIRTEFQSVVNTSNNVEVKNQEFHFRAFVQKGNNGVLVKQLLKKRWWWHIQQKDPNQANLFWSQWFKKDFTDNMQSLSFQNMKTCFNDYIKISCQQQQKIKSVKMIADQETFRKVKPRISLRNVNYFKNNYHQQQYFNASPQNMVKNITPSNISIHNHIDGCLQMHSKKLLFKNLYNHLKKKQWDPFSFIPVTFYIDKSDSASFCQFLKKYDQIQSSRQQQNAQNIWIVKPGQNSNRGFGITVHKNRSQIEDQIKKRLSKNQHQQFKRSVIVQKYLQNCFLINNRKFDIRCYILITTVNGLLKGYWYHDGYIRTSSEQYDLKDISNPMIHLTNDAVQKNNANYGKFQDYNKMTFQSFKKYIAKLKISQSQFDQAYQQMKLIAYYLIASVSSKIKRKQYTFELFGLDFMLDESFKVYLIQANSNPCLDTSGLILSKLIRQLIDNVLMTAVDPLFPPPINQLKKAKQNLTKDYFKQNKFQLIFTQGVKYKQDVQQSTNEDKN